MDISTNYDIQKLLVFYILKYNNKAVKSIKSKFTLQLSLYIYIIYVHCPTIYYLFV